MPDRDGAMTMTEISAAWAKDRERIEELKTDKRLAKQYVQNLETDLRKTKAKLDAVKVLVTDDMNDYLQMRHLVNALQEQEFSEDKLKAAFPNWRDDDDYGI
jgi:hypothetical protein